MDNRVLTDGFAFVEFVSSNPSDLIGLFEKFGFTFQGKSDRELYLMTQGAAAFIVNGEPNTFEAKHGASVRAIGIRVNDAQRAHAQALAGGARSACAAAEGAFVIETPAILGIGDSLVYFVDTNFHEKFS